ncbi:toll-like receptor 21 [Pygocentrus nattereri]|uniref:TIR domain-containing protein n=1 Tax=Pygocentrus nattereri TaxID=42514 RepID=A0A3B4E727_PYGNA|nr:toll-like receptor 21 [Pygocentrus nattereri]
MYCELISVAILATFLHLGNTYSFRNCIETANSNHTIFKCANHQEKSVKEIVDDVLLSATNVTINFCTLSHIPSGSFSNLPMLEVLTLNHNSVGTISKDAFVNLTYLRTLNLSSNAISYFSPYLFRGLHNLTELFLADNRLANLSQDFFSDLTNLNTLDLHRNRLVNFSAVVQSISKLSALRKLDLSFNNLINLNHSASLPQSLAILYIGNNKLMTLGSSKEFLSSVKVLDLSYNKFLPTSAFNDLNLGSITYLRLRSTNVSVIKLLNSTRINVPPWHIDFSGFGLKTPQSLCKQLSHYPMKHMKQMDLQSNSIQILSSSAFSSCPHITDLLDLSHNDMKSVSCLEFLTGQKHLEKLRVENNHLTKLITCNITKNLSFPSLRELSYRYNRILEVNAFAFSHVPKLTKLQLNINIIAYLDRKALSGLRDLVFLRLDNNLLSDIYAESFEDLHSLKKLIMRNNQIAVIFRNTFLSLRNLNILDLGGNKITHFQDKAFNGLDSLTNLYLDRNRLKEIDSQQLGKFSGTLEVLDLQGNYIRFSKLERLSPFENLTKLIDLKLDGQLPYGINVLPQAFFRGLTSLKSLYLKNNYIAYFSSDIFDDLKNLTLLTLTNSGVGVTKLMPGIFKNLRKLEMLLVENMGIESFSKEVFGNLMGLKVLDLNHNALQTLDVELLENLTNLQYLDLRNSPLSCNCDNQDLQNWTTNNQRVQLVQLYSLTCQDINGSYFYNFDINVCYVKLELYFFASTYTVTILLTLIPLLYVKLYWKLKYSYYVFRSWFGEQWRRLREQEEKCIYDAFISYNSADEKWVMEQLLPNLEGNGSVFRLCLHHRDFEPGRNIVDNIVAAVYNSRKTVCVVSQNFLRSEWCSLEIQMASYRLFHEMQDVLLLVFLESIPERQLSTFHRMRKVMLKKTYLQWPGPDCTDPIKAQGLFWKQLKRALTSSNSTSQEKEWMEADVQRREQRDVASMEEGEYLVNQPQMDEEACYLMP